MTRACLQRIERLNPALNAFITVTPEEALAQARTADAEVRRGRWRGPLHGIPLGLKDNIDTAGVRTTLASAVFENRVPSADAEVVRRLKAAGAVLLGKQNLHEVAFGTTAAVSHFGPVHNPWQHDRITSGSSGGSAAAVAAGLCLGAVATDAGGSIRVPSAYCGLVGLKPTYGLVGMRGGGGAGWWSMNHLGALLAAQCAASSENARRPKRASGKCWPSSPSGTADPRVVAKELGARYVMEGSLRQAGLTLRVAVQLVDASTGAHLWAETFDRQFRAEGVFALQDDLVPRFSTACGASDFALCGIAITAVAAGAVEVFPLCGSQ